MPIHLLDVNYARSQFPALKTGFIYGDNAGGSQVAVNVADRIYEYLLNSNAQFGADYSVSMESTRRVMVEAPEAAMKLFNAHSPDEIVFGASSTINLENLARGMEDDIQAADEFILTGEHEANAGPWKRLAARRGAVVKYWTPTPTSPNNPYSLNYKVEELLPLITSKTRILAFAACSNILGTILPVKDIVHAARDTAKEKGSKKLEISLDCVAYAPHRLIDVRDWDVNFCVFSFYKVYGPHISALYVRMSSLKESISAITHHFLKVHQKSYKLQPGGPGYELVYGTTGVLPYLFSLTPENDLKASFDAIAAHEQKLVQPLLAYLTAPEQIERGVRIVGAEAPGITRVPTISFIVVGEKVTKSSDIVKVFDKKGGIGIRFGHFYAYSLVKELEPRIDVDDGVVRISLVHYNTAKEVERIIEILTEALA
ncbi:pyridoxal phosphate-dependent transferase [Lentinula aciculospora]|uniref:Pyridoxal phosphate-dependent transferase n=1 Tax=Lentinula aciculospora TaxID=153920 RepID=A0A9W9DP26_9AGAR|nr:pyridoxal phosphate-dependent transferase [Lentinula aciculospora]